MDEDTENGTGTVASTVATSTATQTMPTQTEATEAVTITSITTTPTKPESDDEWEANWENSPLKKVLSNQTGMSEDSTKKADTSTKTEGPIRGRGRKKFDDNENGESTLGPNLESGNSSGAVSRTERAELQKQ